MAAKEGFQSWRSKAGHIIGWKLPAPGSPTGSVLVVHGNAGCALDRGYIARPIHEAASRDVYVLEYPGYGARAGSPSMKSFLAASEEAFAALPGHLPIHLVSESLGAGVAAHLAKVHGKRVSGLMMFAPYNNLASVGQRHMPFLPVRLILCDRFNPAEWLKDYRGPVSIMLAGADEVIPSDLGRKLHDGYAGPKLAQYHCAERGQKVVSNGKTLLGAKRSDHQLASLWSHQSIPHYGSAAGNTHRGASKLDAKIIFPGSGGNSRACPYRLAMHNADYAPDRVRSPSCLQRPPSRFVLYRQQQFLDHTFTARRTGGVAAGFALRHQHCVPSRCTGPRCAAGGDATGRDQVGPAGLHLAAH
jgi:hypothetical protein